MVPRSVTRDKVDGKELVWIAYQFSNTHVYNQKLLRVLLEWCHLSLGLHRQSLRDKNLHFYEKDHQSRHGLVSLCISCQNLGWNWSDYCCSIWQDEQNGKHCRHFGSSKWLFLQNSRWCYLDEINTKFRYLGTSCFPARKNDHLRNHFCQMILENGHHEHNRGKFLHGLHIDYIWPRTLFFYDQVSQIKNLYFSVTFSFQIQDQVWKLLYQMNWVFIKGSC